MKTSMLKNLTFYILFKVECKVSGIYRNLELKTPIILGTIPLTSLQPPLPAAVSPGGVAPQSVISPTPVGPGDVPMQWNQTPSGPPPYGPAVLPPADGQPSQWGPTVPTPAPGIAPSSDGQPQQWGPTPGPPPASAPVSAPSTDAQGGQPNQWGPAAWTQSQGPSVPPGESLYPTLGQ